MPMSDALGDRMKRYEDVPRAYLMRRCPVIVRVDGRAFHTLTRDCDRPFDSGLVDAMTGAALGLPSEVPQYVPPGAGMGVDEVPF